MILQVVREMVLAGREDEYRQVEIETARACAEFGCPHPHLALETVEGPMEVWWLNIFDSESHRQSITSAYAAHTELMRVLRANSQRKAGLTSRPIDILAGYRADLSQHRGLVVAGVRFLVAAVDERSALSGGTLFDADDGTQLRLMAARSETDVRMLVAETASPLTVLEVQPRWGVPAAEWIAADPEFWKVNPSAPR